MSNNYLRLGYIAVRLIKVISALALVFVVLLIAGQLTGWADISNWITITGTGEVALWIFGDSVSNTSLPDWVIYFSMIRFTVTLGIWIFVLQILEKVLRSAEDLKTFRMDNILYFRKIAFGFLLLALIDLLGLSQSLESFTVTFSLNLAYFMLALASFLLSEVFREGHELYEQNRLMI